MVSAGSNATIHSIRSGKLRTEPGRGSFWVGTPAGRLQPENPNLLVNIEAGQELPSKKTYPKSEISRFRYLIEGQSGRLAAMRITDSEIAQLEKNLNTFKSQTRDMDLEASAQTDFEFHQMIVEFSGVHLFRDEAPIAWASRMLAKSFSLFIVAARKRRCPKGAPAILDDHHT
jgi:DNA-binding FadR family transcriptional regulator